MNNIGLNLAKFFSIFALIVLALAGCDEDVEKREQIIPSEAKFAGEGAFVQYFWDGENKCPATYQVTMSTASNKTAIIKADGPDFTFGSEKGAMCNKSGEVQYTFKGTYTETNLSDNTTDQLQTEFTFTDCNDGAFKAKGAATRTGNGHVYGNVKCLADDGEILMEMGLDLKPMAG